MKLLVPAKRTPMRCSALAKLVLTATFACIASAAPAQTVDAPAGGACEVHVFSSARASGPVVKSTFVRTLAPSTDPFSIVNILDPTARLSDLTDDEIRQALGLGADYSVMRHSDRIITRATRKTPGPLLEPSPSCYAELMAYEAALMPAARTASGRDKLWISFLYREFAGSAQPRFRFNGSGEANLKPVKKTAKDNYDLAMADLRDGSRELLADFGKKLARKRGTGTSD
ncbi:MAG TPA: hypothetical protein VEW25_12805 [Allosphingosinicella sp.]|nr:hypothetical protein [Allosphingosinicella sp.]